MLNLGQKNECTTTISRSISLQIAQQLAETFAQTAAVRDKQGGNPKAERDLIRQSGLLGLSIPKQYGGQEADWQTILKPFKSLPESIVH